MRLIEGALQDSYRPGVLADLERGIRWKHGSVDSILAGGDPTPADEDELPDATPQQYAAAINRKSDDELIAAGIEEHDIPLIRALAGKFARQGGPGEKGTSKAFG